MDELTKSITAILLATISVATLSVIVSRQNNTSGVISAAGKAYNDILRTAVNPFGSGGGSGVNFNASLPSTLTLQ